MERHLTVSGLVVHEGRFALHWHRKLGAWLPAGGHVELGEDPVQAVLREVREEFAIEAEVMRLASRVEYAGGPGPLGPPPPPPPPPPPARPRAPPPPSTSCSAPTPT